jgi:hypothetical protein
LKDKAKQNELLKTMESVLLKNLNKIEKLTCQIDVGESPTKKYGPVRLGFIQRYLAIVMFLKYFVILKEGKLFLNQNQLELSQKQEYLKNLNMTKETKITFYNSIISNFFFYVQRISGIKKKHNQQIFIDNFFKIIKFYVLLFKCLFYLDDDFHQVLKNQFKNVLMFIIASENIKGSERFIKNSFYYFFEITINENLFEEFYCIINLVYMLDQKYELNNQEMSSCMEKIPGLQERIQNLVSHKSNVSLEDIKKVISFPIMETSIAPQFIEFLFENLCLFDKNKKTFKPNSKPRKKFLQNLFYNEENILNDIVFDLRNNKSKKMNLEWFYWENPRLALANKYLGSKDLGEWFFAFYDEFKQALSSLKENQDSKSNSFSESDVLAEMILIYFQVIKANEQQAEFLLKIYNQSGEELKSMLDNLKKKLKSESIINMNNPLSLLKNSPKKTFTKKSKKRVSQLMKRIKKKTRKVSKSIIKDQDMKEISNELCLSCHEPIEDPKESTVIVKMHTYYPERLLEGRGNSTDKFHMATTCGHGYHFKCINLIQSSVDSENEQTFTCLFCNQSGSLLIQNSGLDVSNDYFFDLAEDEFKNSIHLPKNLVDFLLNPFLQAIRVLKLMDEERMVNNVVPVLAQFANILYSKHKRLEKNKIKKIVSENFNKIMEKVDSLFNPNIVNFEKLLDTVCPSFLFGNYILFSQIKQIYSTKIDFSNTILKKQFISQNLQNLIQNNVWKFVILKILQKEKLDLSEINEELIISECFDIFHVVIFLEQCLITFTDSLSKKENTQFIEKKVLGTFC